MQRNKKKAENKRYEMLYKKIGKTKSLVSN